MPFAEVSMFYWKPILDRYQTPRTSSNEASVTSFRWVQLLYQNQKYLIKTDLMKSIY
jgi:hypothetical protein